MPNMTLIWLKTKELQSSKVDFSWQSIMGPLVIGSTSYHREYLLSSEAPLIIEKTSSYRECKASWDLLSSEAPLIIESTSYHRKHLLSPKRPLLIESAKHHGTSCHQKHLLSSRVPLIIGSTSYHRKDLFLSRVQSIMGPLVIESTSYHREYLLSSERPLIIGDTSSRSTSCYRKAFLSDRERHRNSQLAKLPGRRTQRHPNPFSKFYKKSGPLHHSLHQLKPAGWKIVRRPGFEVTSRLSFAMNSTLLG